jgi:hypothetical protein
VVPVDVPIKLLEELSDTARQEESLFGLSTEMRINGGTTKSNLAHDHSRVKL